MALGAWRTAVIAGALAAALGGCATTGTAASSSGTASAEAPKARPLPPGLDPAGAPDPYPSTYRPLPSRTTAIVGATVLTATGQQIDGGTVVFENGRIAAVGAGLAPPEGAQVIDGRGKWVTPGLIDAHSHLGVYPTPEVGARSDGNEATDPNTAGVWAEHSIWPQDPGLNRARAGGVTSLLVLPGSANLFGGRGVVIKNVPSVTMQGLKFPGAPYSLKMACGENPKRVYGGRQRSPATAMGNVLGYRRAWIDAADYSRRWAIWREKMEKREKDPDAKGDPPDPPKRDIQLDTLAGVLEGRILVQNHCYRADEMAVMIDLAREFGYRIAAFHHASEAYKVAPLLKQEGICTATWADWAAFKMESFDGIEAGAAIVDAAGACLVIKSDDQVIIQHLNQEAAIAMGAGLRAGMPITRAHAIGWVTLNPAKALGVGDKTGSLEPGKMADVVLWDRDPFSVYAKADKVFVDGALVFDRADPRYQPRSDFELGQPGAGVFQ